MWLPEEWLNPVHKRNVVLLGCFSLLEANVSGCRLLFLGNGTFLMASLLALNMILKSVLCCVWANLTVKDWSQCAGFICEISRKALVRHSFWQ